MHDSFAHDCISYLSLASRSLYMNVAKDSVFQSVSLSLSLSLEEEEEEEELNTHSFHVFEKRADNSINK